MYLALNLIPSTKVNNKQTSENPQTKINPFLEEIRKQTKRISGVSINTDIQMLYTLFMFWGKKNNSTLHRKISFTSIGNKKTDFKDIFVYV